MTEQSAERVRLEQRLHEADAKTEARQYRDAFEAYKYVREFSGDDIELRARAIRGVYKLTALGVDRDVAIRTIAWLVLVGSIIGTLVIFASTSSALMAASSLSIAKIRNLMYAEAVGWMLSGAAVCYLLHRFAEVVDRGRVIEAHLALLSSQPLREDF